MSDLCLGSMITVLDHKESPLSMMSYNRKRRLNWVYQAQARYCSASCQDNDGKGNL